MNVPSELLYTKNHEWAKMLDDSTAEVGLTDHAQEELGDIVYINLPEESENVTAGDAVADVESVKAVSDVYSPFTGTIAAINETLDDAPGAVNQAPYDTFLFKVSGISDKEELLTAAEYEAFLKEEE